MFQKLCELDWAYCGEKISVAELERKETLNCSSWRPIDTNQKIDSQLLSRYDRRMSIPVVNEKDEIIGYKERTDIDPAVDIVRSASLWITNHNGDVLLAQRKFTKRNNPGKWSEAVGGTVEGEGSYESTMLRETKEEIGITLESYEVGPKQYISSPTKYFVQWYKAVIDKPIEAFKVQEEDLPG